MTRFCELSLDQLAETFTEIVGEVHAREMDVLMILGPEGATLKIGAVEPAE